MRLIGQRALKLYHFAINSSVESRKTTLGLKLAAFINDAFDADEACGHTNRDVHVDLSFSENSVNFPSFVRAQVFHTSLDLKFPDTSSCYLKPLSLRCD